MVVSSGIMMMPPPTPNAPESTPPIAPIRMSSSTCPTVRRGTGGTGSCGDDMRRLQGCAEAIESRQGRLLVEDLHRLEQGRADPFAAQRRAQRAERVPRLQ